MFGAPPRPPSGVPSGRQPPPQQAPQVPPAGTAALSRAGAAGATPRWRPEPALASARWNHGGGRPARAGRTDGTARPAQAARHAAARRHVPAAGRRGHSRAAVAEDHQQGRAVFRARQSHRPHHHLRCRHRRDRDAFIEVDEVTLQGEVKRIFTGWVFAASPGLHAVEHPIYDVWLTDCKNPVVAVAAPPPEAAAPVTPEKPPLAPRRGTQPQTAPQPGAPRR